MQTTCGRSIRYTLHRFFERLCELSSLEPIRPSVHSSLLDSAFESYLGASNANKKILSTFRDLAQIPVIQKLCLLPEFGTSHFHQPKMDQILPGSKTRLDTPPQTTTSGHKFSFLKRCVSVGSLSTQSTGLSLRVQIVSLILY